MGEPWGVRRMKAQNDMYARLRKDVEDNLRSKAVTTWFENAEKGGGSNAKAETAAMEM